MMRSDKSVWPQAGILNRPPEHGLVAALSFAGAAASDPSAARTIIAALKQLVAAELQSDLDDHTADTPKDVPGSRFDRDSAAEVAGSLLASASAHLNADEALVADSVGAARQACGEMDIPDPLPTAAAMLFEMASQLVPAEVAIVHAQRPFAGLPDEDRKIVRDALPPLYADGAGI